MDGVDVGLVVVIVFDLVKEVDAFVVHAALQRDRGGLRLRGAIAVAVENVDNGAAIADDVSLEVPGSAKGVLQEEFVGAGGLAIDCVVGAHEGAGVGFGDGAAKCG